MNKIECSNCSAQAKIERGSYHFKECGLTNVALLGIEIIRCPECGNEDPIIPRFNDLMRTLALAVVTKPYRLQGEDVRFLRKYLGLKGEDFAQLLNVDKTTLSKWENGADRVGDQSDRLIRVVAVMACDQLKEKLDALLELFRQKQSRRQSVKIEMKMNTRDLSYCYV